LDVRPLKQEAHSGTPFFQLLSEFPQLDFIEIGIQPQCNARAHLDWSKDRGAKIITIDELRDAKFATQWNELLKSYQGRPCLLSVDIDAFSSTVAPGCSQSWAWGLTPNEYMQLFAPIAQFLHLTQMGIYEVSPALDQDSQTSKLAALIAHRWLFAKRN
jgi:formiminoglutamase